MPETESVLCLDVVEAQAVLIERTCLSKGGLAWRRSVATTSLYWTGGDTRCAGYLRWEVRSLAAAGPDGQGAHGRSA